MVTSKALILRKEGAGHYNSARKLLYDWHWCKRERERVKRVLCSKGKMIYTVHVARTSWPKKAEATSPWQRKPADNVLCVTLPLNVIHLSEERERHTHTHTHRQTETETERETERERETHTQTGREIRQTKMSLLYSGCFARACMCVWSDCADIMCLCAHVLVLVLVRVCLC